MYKRDKVSLSRPFSSPLYIYCNPRLLLSSTSIPNIKRKKKKNYYFYLSPTGLLWKGEGEWVEVDG